MTFRHKEVYQLQTMLSVRRLHSGEEGAARWFLQNECAYVPLNAAGVTKVGGFTLCSMTTSAVMDKKCLFFNIPGITCFHIPGVQTLLRGGEQVKKKIE